MSHQIKGQSRTQATLFPEALDDFVTDENHVRVIDVFVDSLDLAKLGFEKVTTKATGRPCYHPGTMLKLYIYGYLNRIQSSRRLEKETHRTQRGTGPCSHTAVATVFSNLIIATLVIGVDTEFSAQPGTSEQEPLQRCVTLQEVNLK